MVSPNKKGKSKHCSIDDASCSDHSAKDERSERTKSRDPSLSKRDKLLMQELQNRIESKITNDPEIAKKAAKIIQLWIDRENAKTKEKLKKVG